MGVVLDSTAFISAERKGFEAAELAFEMQRKLGTGVLLLSAVTLAELSFGIVKADSEKRQARRTAFLQEVQANFDVVPVTGPIAIRAGLLQAELEMLGWATDLPDLMIGSTAFELDYAVATANVRHFMRIPGLRVIEL